MVFYQQIPSGLPITKANLETILDAIGWTTTTGEVIGDETATTYEIISASSIPASLVDVFADYSIADVDQILAVRFAIGQAIPGLVFSAVDSYRIIWHLDQSPKFTYAGATTTISMIGGSVIGQISDSVTTAAHISIPITTAAVASSGYFLAAMSSSA